MISSDILIRNKMNVCICLLEPEPSFALCKIKSFILRLSIDLHPLEWWKPIPSNKDRNVYNIKRYSNCFGGGIPSDFKNVIVDLKRDVWQWSLIEFELPYLYLIPKLNKNPYKQQYIAGSRKVSTKSLSLLLSKYYKTAVIWNFKSTVQQHIQEAV